MKLWSRSTALVSAGLVTGAVAFVATQSATPPPASTQDPRTQHPTFRTAANYVRVDAYPTANGQIVADLTQADFEILEDGVPQKIDTFERITFRPPGPESERRELSTIAESNDAAADPRSRLFVLFLDSYHTSVDATTVWVTGGVGAGTSSGGVDNKKGGMTASANSRFGRPLARFLEGLIGADDLIGIMRPEMSAASLSFTRRPSSFEEFLMTGGMWQRQDLDRDLDVTERMYFSCYDREPAVVAEMIARRREHLVIEGLRNVVLRLQALRDGRKALLVVSEGWELYRPSNQLVRTLDGQSSVPRIGTVGGRLTSDDALGRGRKQCDDDRRMLAELDNERDFREMLDDANRANVTFYPIDPRGLAADSGVQPSGAARAQNKMFRNRRDALLSLATATDGVAIVDSNNFASNLRRIADDMSSYYLMAYYSTNGQPDGKFRRITVRVKRPGVDVRARRGYRAATKAELDARAKDSAGVPKAAPVPLTVALGELGAVRLDAAVHVRTGYGWQGPASAKPGALVWVVGELDPAAARQLEWQAGGTATITLSSGNGAAIATAEQRLSTVSRSFMVLLPSDTPLAAGDYTLKVAWRGPSLPAGDAFNMTIPPMDVSPGSVPGQPLLMRRGPFTAVTYQATADTRFRRQERLRVDLPVGGTIESSSARLLDRAGRPLSVPITVGRREESGLVFVTAALILAPLAPGDYVVELTLTSAGRAQTILTAFRIVP